MSYFIVLCAIVTVALWPLLQRFYIERFWIHGRGTVIRLETGFSTSENGSGWLWAPIVEYDVAGQRFTSTLSYLQPYNAKPKYSVGDEVKILYSPREPSRCVLNSWTEHIFLTIIFSGLVVGMVLSGRK